MGKWLRKMSDSMRGRDRDNEDDDNDDNNDNDEVPQDALRAIDEYLKSDLTREINIGGNDDDGDDDDDDEDSPGWQERLQRFAQSTSPEFYQAANDCYGVANDTVLICENMQGINQKMVGFCTEVETTLHALGGGGGGGGGSKRPKGRPQKPKRKGHKVGEERVEVDARGIDVEDNAAEEKSGEDKSKPDASIMETLQDLASGEQVREAAELAKELLDAAKRCVVQSTSMMDHLQRGLESLPRFARRAIQRRGRQLLSQEDLKNTGDGEALQRNMLLVRGIDQDMQDVELCIQAIKELNLVTAFKVGMKAFEELTQKTQTTKALFAAIFQFASDVRDITAAVKDMNIRTIIDKAPDICRCLVMTDQMRQLSVGTGKLVPVMINLFEHTAERVSSVWQALAYAKNCMQTCVDFVLHAKKTSRDAYDSSRELVVTSRSVCDQLGTTRDINPDTVNVVRKLASNRGDIQRALELAGSMDDRVLDCVQKTMSMITKVSDGFTNLPEVLTDGIDKDRAGEEDNDPEIPDVEADIVELEEAKRQLENSNLLQATRQGINGFEGIINKSGLCQNLLDVITDFANQSDRTIDAFMKVWDLESAQTKIMEMCRLVHLGELMKKFAAQIQRLVKAIMALLKAALDKYNNLDWSDIGDMVGDVVDDVRNQFKDKMSFFRK